MKFDLLEENNCGSCQDAKNVVLISPGWQEQTIH